jgi:hypothetical protein
VRRYTLTLTTEYSGMTETEIAQWAARMHSHGWPSISLTEFINGTAALHKTGTGNTAVRSRATVEPQPTQELEP